MKSTTRRGLSWNSIFNTPSIQKQSFHTHRANLLPKFQNIRTPTPINGAPSPHPKKQLFPKAPLTPKPRDRFLLPTYRPISLHLPSILRGPTRVVEFILDQKMSKPELKQWLTVVYGLRIEKIHTANHFGKVVRHRPSRRLIHRRGKKKAYVVLKDEVDFTDGIYAFSEEARDEILKKDPKIKRSMMLDWSTRRWLKTVNPIKGKKLPDGTVQPHRSRHKLMIEELKKRRIVEDTVKTISELQYSILKAKQEQGVEMVNEDTQEGEKSLEGETKSLEPETKSQVDSKSVESETKSQVDSKLSSQIYSSSEPPQKDEKFPEEEFIQDAEARELPEDKKK